MDGFEDECGCAIGNNGANHVPVFANSSALGTLQEDAVLTGISRKGYWHFV